MTITIKTNDKQKNHKINKNLGNWEKIKNGGGRGWGQAKIDQRS
jgi:hypothetical protein